MSVQSERGCSLVKFLVMLDGGAFHELAHTKMPSIAVNASACWTCIEFPWRAHFRGLAFSLFSLPPFRPGMFLFLSSEMWRSWFMASECCWAFQIVAWFTALKRMINFSRIYVLSSIVTDINNRLFPFNLVVKDWDSGCNFTLRLGCCGGSCCQNG